MALSFELEAQQQPFEFIFPAKVRSTHSRNEWMAALNSRFRPRLRVFNPVGFITTPK
jgi:hypothetical protein